MKTILLSLIMILFSCTKQNSSPDCGLTGTWQGQVKTLDPNNPTILILQLNADFTMISNGNKGYIWRVDTNCSALEYIYEKNNGYYTRWDIINNDGNHFKLRFAFTNIALNPFDYQNEIELNRIK